MEISSKTIIRSAGILHIITGILLISLCAFLIDLKLFRASSNFYVNPDLYKDIFLEFHLLVILAVTGIVGGGLLLWGKRIGWIFSAAIYFSYTAYIIGNFIAEGDFDFDYPSYYLLFFGTIFLTFLVLGLLLMTRKLKERFCADTTAYLLISGIVILVVTDKLLLA